MATVKVRVMGIPVEARFNAYADEQGRGTVIEDLTFHNINNGSELVWLERKIAKAGQSALHKVYEDVCEAYLSQPREEGPDHEPDSNY